MEFFQWFSIKRKVSASTTVLQKFYTNYYVGLAEKSGSIVVCISPLTSLMMDQCTKFVSRGISAEFIGEAQTSKDAIKRVLSGQAQLVFATPESLVENERYRNMLQSSAYKGSIVALAVDEAHCVKTWGDQFRQTFAKIGDLRSLLSADVNILALTATATMETYSSAVSRLGMRDPVLVSVPPERANIYFTVYPKTNLEEFVGKLTTEFLLGGFPKTVIFVRTYKDCSNIYLMLQQELGELFTSPPGYPNVEQFRQVEMFTRVLTVEKRNQVLATFGDPATPLKLIICTSAFGMGVDIPDIRRVVHWGLPSTIEEYVQESGQAGRDGKDSVAILYEGKGGKHSNVQIKNYVSNTLKCRRRFLFEGFLSYYEAEIKVTGCKYCDVCKRMCACECCQSLH